MNSNKRSGMSSCGVLFMIFVVLKLLNLINWSWIWVLAPLWIPVCILVAAAILYRT